MSDKLFTQMLNNVTCGDCIDVMAHLPSRSVDFVLTDPPYLVRYHDRSGRRVVNDDNDAWLKPAFAQIHRDLKPHSLYVQLLWLEQDRLFMTAWREAGFRISAISSSASAMRRAPGICPTHTSRPTCGQGLPGHSRTGRRRMSSTGTIPATAASDAKAGASLKPLIAAFTRPGDIVLDPFSGSGSTLVAARELDRQFIGIDLDPDHHRTAADRLRRLSPSHFLTSTVTPVSGGLGE